MNRRRAYTESEVRSILRSSESRTSVTGMPGHTGEKHVLITGDALLERGQTAYDKTRNGGVVKPVTAFCDTPTAVRVVTEALNSPEGQAALGYLDGYGVSVGARARSRRASSLSGRVSSPTRRASAPSPSTGRCCWSKAFGKANRTTKFIFTPAFRSWRSAGANRRGATLSTGGIDRVGRAGPASGFARLTAGDSSTLQF